MKRLVVLVVLLIIFIPISFAKEISIPELFTITQESIFVDSGKEVYYYADSKLIASNNGILDYEYQGRLNSDIESKTLPFGQSILIKNRFSFTGKELDQDLYYFGARYYNPSLGRFISVDPVEENHPYAYVKNNPLNLIDPDGMRIKVYGSVEDRGRIQHDLDIMVGAGNAIIENNDEGYFINVVDNYQGDFPKSFGLLKETVEHPTTILLRVSGEDFESKPQTINRHQHIPIGEDNPIHPMDYEMAGVSIGKNGFVKDLEVEESIQELFGRQATYIVTKKTRSGLPEVYYAGESVYHEDLKLTYEPYEILAHELLGHALFYIKGDENSGDILFENVKNDPMAAGAGVYSQNIIRQEHGKKLRETY